MSPRFGRFDSQEAGYWTFPLRKAGIRLHTATDGIIDWSDFTARVMYGLVQEGKHQFLRDLSKNVCRGLLAKARRGEWVQGDNPPYGYALENRRLVFGDEFEIEIIRRIFREYLAGKSVNGIVDRLNIARIPSPGGRTWYTSAVRKILRNIRYTGTFRWPDRIEGKYTTIDEVVVIENNHPAIIDKESFDMAQAKLDSRRKKKGETCHGPNPNYVLSGICRCTKCGSPSL